MREALKNLIADAEAALTELEDNGVDTGNSPALMDLRDGIDDAKAVLEGSN